MATLTVGTPISIKGPQGTPGLSVLTGHGAPANTLGADTQGYIDVDAADVYVKASGAWVKTKNLVGPMGLNGINGSFFTGTGAPTSSTYSGQGQAIYIQTTGEVWTYTDPSKGWVDSGENLVGPQGVPGLRGTQIYHGNGAFDPSLYPNAAVGDMYFQDDAGTYAFITST